MDGPLKCYTHFLPFSSSYFDLYASYLLPCLPRILLPKTVGLLLSSLLSSGTLLVLFLPHAGSGSQPWPHVRVAVWYFYTLKWLWCMWRFWFGRSGMGLGHHCFYLKLSRWFWFMTKVENNGSRFFHFLLNYQPLSIFIFFCVIHYPSQSLVNILNFLFSYSSVALLQENPSPYQTDCRLHFCTGLPEDSARKKTQMWIFHRFPPEESFFWS